MAASDRLGRLAGRFYRAPRPRGPEPVSRDMVVLAYRRLLGREPESEDAITEGMRYASPWLLLEGILNSPEFAGRGLPRMDGGAPPLDVEWQVGPEIAAALLARISETWQRLGKERPYWSVLSDPQFLPDSLPARRQAFYDSGAEDVRLLLATLSRIGRRPAEFPLAFEFGCGVGRVTGHLARQFARVIACDVSPAHLAFTRDCLGEQGVANVESRQATAADFGMSEPFDLWFNRIVLQHNPPPLIAAILERALRLLRPGGIASFQVPVYLTGYRFKVDEYLQQPADSAAFEMHLLPQPAIFEIARRNGCRVLEIRQEDSAGPYWISQFVTLEKS